MISERPLNETIPQVSTPNMTVRYAFLAFWILLSSTAAAISAEPVLAERQPFRGSDYSWRLSQSASLVLDLFEGQSEIPFASYDLENCVFCEGEDDNCESDGIVEINLTTRPEEPILAVTCHVGAHSQRFQILAPWRNKTDAAYSVSGDYYVLYEIDSAGVSVEYDVRNADGTFESLFGSWP